jgi:hypothetical protein
LKKIDVLSVVSPWLASMAVAGTLAGVAPGVMISFAQDTVEATYVRYHKAIRAAERCRRDLPFGSSEQSRMADYFDGKTDVVIATRRRLQLIEQAKRDVDKLVDNQGCTGDVA